MTLTTRFLVYPDGDTQETDRELRVNDVVDLNGRPLSLPLSTVKIIAYQVSKIRRVENRGEITILYHLDLMRREDLLEFGARDD